MDHTPASRVAHDVSIDFHVHLAPRLAPEDLFPNGVTMTGSGHYSFDGHAVGMADLYRPEALLRFLAENRIGRACVSVPPPFYRQRMSQESSSKWTAALNDGLLRVCSPHNELLPLIYLPLEHPEVAIQTLREYLDRDESAGWTACAGGLSGELESPELDVLWSLLAADGRPVLLHPGKTPDPRMSKYYLDNLLGNPVETAVAAAELVFGGVLSKHPDLQILLVHCGGVLPSIAGRWQQGQDTSRPGVDIPAGTVRQLLRLLYVDCLVHEPAALHLAETVFGQDRMVLGSDWPFPMGLTDPYSAMEGKSADFINRVAVENAARLLTPAARHDVSPEFSPSSSLENSHETGSLISLAKEQK